MIYCTKFVSGVREEDLEWALSTLESSVLPALSRLGFLHPLVVTKRRRMERVNREKAEDAVEALARRMEREARRLEPRDPSLQSDIDLLCHIVLVGARSSAEGMLFHHKKRKRAVEYERLKEERDSLRNRDVVDGVQLDVYTRHASEVAESLDEMDSAARRPFLPLAVKSFENALSERHFLGAKVINYLTFMSSGGETRREARHALQLYVDVPGKGRKRFDDPRDVRARLRALVDGVAGDHGAEGIFALKSLRTGVTRDLSWRPDGIPQHRGDETDKSGKAIRFSDDIYEAVLFFGTEDRRNEALKQIDGGLPGVVGRKYIDEGSGAYAISSGEAVIVS